MGHSEELEFGVFHVYGCLFMEILLGRECTGYLQLGHGLWIVG